MKHENVDVSITGNSTNPTRFQHLVAGTYKKWALENGKKYFSVASGGGTGRNAPPRQHGGRPRLPDGLTDSNGQNARRRTVCRLLLRSRARRDDGTYRHGQQPHGRCDRCSCAVAVEEATEISDFQISQTIYGRFVQKRPFFKNTVN